MKVFTFKFTSTIGSTDFQISKYFFIRRRFSLLMDINVFAVLSVTMNFKNSMKNGGKPFLKRHSSSVLPPTHGFMEVCYSFINKVGYSSLL